MSLSSSDRRETRATVRDAAVVWAGQRDNKRGNKKKGTRGSEGAQREVADSERKISRRGSRGTNSASEGGGAALDFTEMFYWSSLTCVALKAEIPFIIS